MHRIACFLVLALVFVADASACMIVPSAVERIWFPLGIMLVFLLWACASLYVAAGSYGSKITFVVYALFLAVVVVLLVQLAFKFNFDGAVDCGHGTTKDFLRITLFSMFVAALGTFVSFFQMILRKKI